jgi:hypothetical protein
MRRRRKASLSPNPRRLRATTTTKLSEESEGSDSHSSATLGKHAPCFLFPFYNPFQRRISVYLPRVASLCAWYVRAVVYCNGFFFFLRGQDASARTSMLSSKKGSSENESFQRGHFHTRKPPSRAVIHESEGRLHCRPSKAFYTPYPPLGVLSKERIDRHSLSTLLPFNVTA